ncbi:MAG: sigma-70 family RNA polymerase sigma factor [Chloroflexota bacterium]
MAATATLPNRTWDTYKKESKVSIESMNEVGKKQTTPGRISVPVSPDLSASTDEELMLAIGKGRADALEALYDRHVRGCFGLAMKIVREPTVAEEVVQDVFVKLWSKPSVFTPERGKFSGWLLTLVHNRSVDKLRRAKSGLAANTMPLDMEGENGVSLADVIADESLSPDDVAWRNEKGEIVRRAMEKLPTAQQQAISLAYFGGLTQKEIAEKLEEPLGTIKTRTRSALQQLRRVLQYEGVWGDLS